MTLTNVTCFFLSINCHHAVLVRKSCTGVSLHQWNLPGILALKKLSNTTRSANFQGLTVEKWGALEYSQNWITVVWELGTRLSKK